MSANPADTIYALSSAPGKAAVSIIRISGPRAAHIAETMAAPPLVPRRAALRTVRYPSGGLGDGQVIDDALALLFQAPASATGEDLLELHVHGGRAVLDAMFKALATYDGCRLAEPGEFSRRGFENGKLDLTAAEGIADLIDAETEAQRRQARQQADGALQRLYNGWRSQLIQAQALVEAAIDFSDESDVADGAIQAGLAVAKPLLEAIKNHLAGADRGEIIRTGFRVVIAGPPNAGKSSLLNALAKRDAAIVSEEAGTTRDVIEVHLDLDGLSVIITDTAGVRHVESAVEREGIRRAIERARASDLIVWLESVDYPTEPPPELTKELPRNTQTILRCINKLDLANSTTANIGKQSIKNNGSIGISVRTGQGMHELVTKIVTHAHAAIGSVEDAVPSSARHREHLSNAVKHLKVFLDGPTVHPELAAEDLRQAATEIGRLTGQINVDDVLDQIFSRFCIGK